MELEATQAIHIQLIVTPPGWTPAPGHGPRGGSSKGDAGHVGIQAERVGGPSSGQRRIDPRGARGAKGGTGFGVAKKSWDTAMK